MRYIEKCGICYPKVCTGTGRDRVYFFPLINEDVVSPESLMDCPRFREQTELIEHSKKQITIEELPKLTNWKTGEIYESL